MLDGIQTRTVPVQYEDEQVADLIWQGVLKHFETEDPIAYTHMKQIEQLANSSSDKFRALRRLMDNSVSMAVVHNTTIRRILVY